MMSGSYCTVCIVITNLVIGGPLLLTKSWVSSCILGHPQHSMASLELTKFALSCLYIYTQTFGQDVFTPMISLPSSNDTKSLDTLQFITNFQLSSIR